MSEPQSTLWRLSEEIHNALPTVSAPPPPPPTLPRCEHLARCGPLCVLRMVHRRHTSR